MFSGLRMFFFIVKDKFGVSNVYINFNMNPKCISCRFCYQTWYIVYKRSNMDLLCQTVGLFYLHICVNVCYIQIFQTKAMR